MKNLNFEITNVENLQWADAEKTKIACDVTFAHIGEPISFLAHADYDYQHGVDIYNNAISGDYGPIGDYEVPEAAPELTLDEKRQQAPPLGSLEIRQKLSVLGLKRSAIDAEISKIADQDQQDDIRDLWEYSTQFHRADPTLIEFAERLGLTEHTLDEMWGI